MVFKSIEVSRIDFLRNANVLSMRPETTSRLRRVLLNSVDSTRLCLSQDTVSSPGIGVGLAGD